jgi:uncharacterized protein
MAYYAVQYLYAEEPSVMDGIRAEHRAYLKTLVDAGVLLATGPIVGRNAALLIFKTESPETVATLLDVDPFEIAGYIGGRIIEEWNPLLGVFSEA